MSCRERGLCISVLGRLYIVSAFRQSESVPSTHLQGEIS